MVLNEKSSISEKVLGDRLKTSTNMLSSKAAIFFKLQCLALIFLGFNAYAFPLAEPNEVQISERGAGLNSFLNILLSHLPAIDTSITDATGIITSFDNLLGALTGAQDTYNELGRPCTEWTVIFARGTAEPGNVCQPEHFLRLQTDNQCF